ALTATFTAPDGSFSFGYPGGWVARDNGGAAVLATDDSVLDVGVPLPRGELRADLYAMPADHVPGLPAGAALEDVLAVTTAIAAQPGCAPFSPAEEATAGSRRALVSRQTCASVETVFIV